MTLRMISRLTVHCRTKRCFSSTSTDLRTLIQSGTLYRNPSLSSTPLDLDLWQLYGDHLHKSLRGAAPGAEMSDADAGRIYQLYLPLYFWLRDQLKSSKSTTAAHAALTVGLSCPQGGGKTTLVDYMQELLALDLVDEHPPLSCAVVSMDDFYLTNAAQTALAAQHASNPLLQCRGNFGTHDVQLASSTLEQLRTQRTGSIPVPRYDKSAFNGQGDRSPADTWPSVAAPVDVLLLEGWCLGFEPSASLHTPMLEPVNEYLREWLPVWQALDSTIVVELADTQIVYAWREQAEAAMRAEGRPAMSEEQVIDFVDRYMPAYKQYLPALYAKASSTSAATERRLHFAVDNSRMPISSVNN